MERRITHRCGKLLAAWLIAGLDLKSFWAAAQKDGDFSDQHLTLGLQAGSYLEQHRQDQHVKLVYVLEQNSALKHFFDNKPGLLQALSKAWGMVNPFRILKKYRQYPKQTLPRYLVGMPSRSKDNRVEERNVRIEPGYQHFSKDLDQVFIIKTICNKELNKRLKPHMHGMFAKVHHPYLVNALHYWTELDVLEIP